jgi:hypothetical protein
MQENLNNAECDKILNLLIRQVNQNTDDGCNNYKDLGDDSKIMMTIIIIIQFNSIQFFIIYVPSQQPNGHLQTQHNLNAGIYTIEKKIIIINSINSVKIFSLRVKN